MPNTEVKNDNGNFIDYQFVILTMKNGLTKIMVKMVKTMIDLPCAAVASIWALASLDSSTFACFCLISRRLPY